MYVFLHGNSHFLSLTGLFLKVNILVDEHDHACLADFGLVAIISDPEHPTTSISSITAGTARWMSPELLNPEHLDFRHGRRTKESDCYALGMVIYEVLSGKVPFASYNNLIVPMIVIQGKRPERPSGLEKAYFADGLWVEVEQCWSDRSEERPTAEAVLECLEGFGSSLLPAV